MSVEQLISYRVPWGDSWLLWSEIKLEGRKAGAADALTGGIGNQSGCPLVGSSLSSRQMKQHFRWASEAQQDNCLVENMEKDAYRSC